MLLYNIMNMILILMIILYNCNSLYIKKSKITNIIRYCNSDPKSLRDNILTSNANTMNRVLTIGSLVSLINLEISTPSSAGEGSVSGISLPRPSKRNHLYSIEMTDPPSLLPRTKVGELSAIKRLVNNDIIIFGDHINSKQDRELESSILSLLNDECRQVGKKIVIGLEMIEKDTVYQTALDTYISNQKVPLEEADEILLSATNWKNIWQGEYDTYLPLLHFARNNKIRLIAMGVAPALQKRVLENGLDALVDSDRSKYVPDPAGFLDTVRKPGFQIYADKVIAASFQADLEIGAIPAKTNLENYFGNRILVDEGIGSSAATYVNDNPATTLVIVSKKERVIFGYGIQERIRRHLLLLKSLNKNNEESADDNGTNILDLEKKISSVLLNPTASDSLSYTSQLQLCLAYGEFLKDQKPLATFIWFSNDPAVKLLTRPKNPISKEGDKPAGESSILKAF